MSRPPTRIATTAWPTSPCCRRFPWPQPTFFEFPRFDLILLGLGPDGHTASLFPETVALQEKSRLVVANWVEKFKTDRITFTLPLLNAARSIAFLVSGTDKAPALHAVLEDETAPAERYPAKLVHPTDGKLIWFLDKAAASELSTKAE